MEFNFYKIVDYKQKNLFTWELTIVTSELNVSKVRVLLYETDLELFSNDLDADTLDDLKVPCGRYLKEQGELIDGEDGDWYLAKVIYIRIFQLPLNNKKIFRKIYKGESTVDLGEYVCVWADKLPGDFEGNTTLEHLYVKFNTNRPFNFGGHSLSVSDIIEVFKADGSSESHYYYCEDAGWSDITEKII